MLICNLNIVVTRRILKFVESDEFSQMRLSITGEIEIIIGYDVSKYIGSQNKRRSHKVQATISVKK